MSKIADKVEELIGQAFPYAKVKKEYFVKYGGQTLFVDFYLPSYLLAIEVHGEQHDKFVEHFHGDAKGWRSHKRRDRLKEEWADVNNITFVVLRAKDIPETAEEFIDFVWSCERDRN